MKAEYMQWLTCVDIYPHDPQQFPLRMELTLVAECWIIFCTHLEKVICLYNYYNVLSPFLKIGPVIDSFHSSGSSSLFQIELISLWISEQIVLLPASVNSAGV
jgi:hypothetical protein